LLDLFFLLVHGDTVSIEEDLKLIKGISEKKEKFLIKLYDKYSSYLFGLIIKIVHNKEDAEEILQEVFVQVWDKALLFDESKGNVIVWLITLTRNKSIDKLRSKSYRNSKITSDIEPFEIFLSGSESDGLNLTLNQERKSIIIEALAKLPEEQRILIQVAYFEGLSQSELASKFEIPLGTVKTRMRSALKKLQSLVMEEYRYE
jgi:RNA polymerase sigma-70 factor, ECF subfamily